MKAANHTPGPWSYRNGYASNGELHVRGEDCRTLGFAPLAKVLGDIRLVDQETRAANARLIAAAPELLGFAQWLLGSYLFEDGIPAAEEIARKARAVIVKATGI